MKTPPYALIMAFLLLFAGACATLPGDVQRPESHAYVETQDTGLADAIRDKVAAHPGESGFHLLSSGLDAFAARAALARAAERSIDAQYYLLHDDPIGHLFVHELLKAADRGVRVRLLVDDMELGGRDLNAAIVDQHPNMEVRLFNPFSRKRLRKAQLVIGSLPVHRRMHNKSFTVDNQVTIVGGRNIGTEYFEANPDMHFGDLDVIGIGPVVRKVSDAFDLFWNNELAYPATALHGRPPSPEQVDEGRKSLDAFAAGQSDSDYLKALRSSDLARDLRRKSVRFAWGHAEVLYDPPEKITRDSGETEFHLTTRLRPYFDTVRTEVIVFSPYFVPGEKGVAFFTQLRRRGARVRILTNSLASNNLPIVHAGYAQYREELLEAGVELYELNEDPGKEAESGEKGPADAARAVLHAKSFVLDRRGVFIGSLNLDPRAIEFNTEIGIILESRQLAEELAAWFDANIDKVAFRLELEKENGKERILWHGMEGGKAVTFDKEPHTGFWRRFSIWLLGLLPIESQL